MNCNECGNQMKLLFTSFYCDCKDNYGMDGAYDDNMPRPQEIYKHSAYNRTLLIKEVKKDKSRVRVYLKGKDIGECWVTNELIQEKYVLILNG